MEAIRKSNLEQLKRDGFRPAEWLPIERELVGKQLRAPVEVASRLMALDAVFTWVAFTEEGVPDIRVQGYIIRNNLFQWMTEEEQLIVQLSRKLAQEEYLNLVGWKLENMWPLAWVLGFEVTPTYEGQIQDSVSNSMIYEFMPGLGADVREWVGNLQPRPLEQVLALEDLFYCAHNAVRSAQLGSATVPEGFHPMFDGGAVQERRHSLSWCVSPNATWHETDLST